MKIRLGFNRERGSIFLICVIATLIIVFGMIMCKYLQRWAKRIDTGEPYPLPGFNTNSVIVPNPENPNITGGYWQDYHLAFLQYYPTNCLISECPIASAMETVIYISRLDTNAVLQIERRIADSGNHLSLTNIGIEVDRNGVPVDFTWSCGYVPSGGECWLVQKSTNLVDWIDVQSVTIPLDYTNAVFDFDVSQSMYYRAIKQ